MALWPLATAAWDLLGLTAGQAWRLALLGVSALVLAAGVAGVNWQRASPVRLAWLILAAWLIAGGAVAALTALAWLVLGTPGLEVPADLTPRALDAIATRAFAIVAGLGGVALLVIAYRRQRTTEADAERAEAAAEREDTKLFHERFTTAYSDLGSEHAAVRLGAVNALAHLADDAASEEEAQMVIDVLCAYLRMPYTPRPDDPAGRPAPPDSPPTTAVDLGRLSSSGHDAAPDDKQKEALREHHKQVLDFESFQQVRHTIIRIIGNRLREPTRWRGKNYDFTGVVFDGGNFQGAHFTGGRVSFNEARFAGGTVSFIGARFTGSMVSFAGARFAGGTVSFDAAKFAGRVTFTRALFTSGWVSFDRAKFADGRVAFEEAVFAGGRVSFSRAEFTGGRVSFDEAGFAGGAVDFTEAVFAKGWMSFDEAVFADGRVSFDEAKFTGRTVSFIEVRFTGTRVSFHEAGFAGGAVDFGWGGLAGDLDDFKRARGVCPEGLREAQDQAAPGVLLFPEAWGHGPGEDGSEPPTFSIP
ncbi:pentapeptide repeat-containing protein (plasmid) [Nocardiopsis flavescens]|nr:pentapeptide repeat-containing protein [Nocardiopsis flavescens]